MLHHQPVAGSTAMPAEPDCYNSRDPSETSIGVPAVALGILFPTSSPSLTNDAIGVVLLNRNGICRGERE